MDLLFLVLSRYLVPAVILGIRIGIDREKILLEHL